MKSNSRGRRGRYGRRSGRLLPAVCAVAAVLWRPAAHGAEVVLNPVKDNTIYEEAADRSNGAGTGLFAGVTNTGNARRALLAFDVASAVPAGATVTSARLTLQVTKTISGQQPMTLHRLLADWGEGQSDAAGEEGGGAAAAVGDATWTRRFFNTQSWSAPGGDPAAEPSATRQVAGPGAVAWGSTPEMVADVQRWLDAPQTNFGWLVRGNEDDAPTAKRFASREAAAGGRPALLIEFAPPQPSTPTPTPTPTATTAPLTPRPTATGAPDACTGDCDGSDSVEPEELIAGVEIALGRVPVTECRAFDTDESDTVTVDELIAAVNNALDRC